MIKIPTILLISLTFVSLCFAHQPVIKKKEPTSELGPLIYGNGVYNLDAIDAQVAQCKVVADLNYLLEQAHVEEESFIQRIFTALFPFGPALNSLLATTYISGPPNLLLALIPPNIDAGKLSTLVSFAVGGLLGDVFLHLLPQTFVGESIGEEARFVLVDEHRNTILGLGMFGGFLMFIILDKVMRIVTSSSGEPSGHSHAHSHSHTTVTKVTGAEDTEDKKSGLRQRKPAEIEIIETDTDNEIDVAGSSAKLSAYLNLIADFTHNITDGLAISASFYVSKSVGATTCLAVFFHEIPHEVGDFALLIQGGFSKSKAMQAQFVTAIGAYLGTFIGIGINYLTSTAGSGSDASAVFASADKYQSGTGIFGTNVSVGDLTLPFTAGGFLYIATVGVIPEILESHESLRGTKAKVLQALSQLLAMFVGIGLMFAISWLE